MKRILSVCAAIALVLTGAMLGCEPTANNAAENAVESAENAINEVENEM